MGLWLHMVVSNVEGTAFYYLHYIVSSFDELRIKYN
jgi:hypothetical protein